MGVECCDRRTPGVRRRQRSRWCVRREPLRELLRELLSEVLTEVGIGASLFLYLCLEGPQLTQFELLGRDRLFEPMQVLVVLADGVVQVVLLEQVELVLALDDHLVRGLDLVLLTGGQLPQLIQTQVVVCLRHTGGQCSR